MDNQIELYKDDADFNEEIAALTGAYVQNSAFLPNLKINRDPEDALGNELPIGKYEVKQGENAVYGKPVFFRPFINCFQYLEYDPTARNYCNKSIYIKKFSEEALDMLGGLKCGKVRREDIEKLSAIEQVRQKNIKCVRTLFGTVSFEGVSATKEKMSLVDLPVTWKLSGANFTKPQASLEAITKNKHQYFHYNLNLDVAKGRKVGPNMFYDPIVGVDMNTVLRFTSEDMETFKMFQEIINRENKFVMDKWKAAKKEAVTEKDIEVSEGLAFPDDEIPF